MAVTSQFTTRGSLIKTIFDNIIAAGGGEFDSTLLADVSAQMATLVGAGEEQLAPATPLEIRTGTDGFLVVTAGDWKDALDHVNVDPSGAGTDEIALNGNLYFNASSTLTVDPTDINSISNLDVIHRRRWYATASGDDIVVTASDADVHNLDTGVTIADGETGVFELYLDGAGNKVVRYLGQQTDEHGAGGGGLSAADASGVNTGTSTTTAVTPDALAGSYAGTKELGGPICQAGVPAATGNGIIGVPVPASMNGMNVVNAGLACHTKGVTGVMTVVLRRRRAGADVDILSTGITMGDEFVAQDGVINTSNDDLATGDLIYPDVDGLHTTPAQGVSWWLEARLP